VQHWEPHGWQQSAGFELQHRAASSFNMVSHCLCLQDALRALEMPRFTRRYPVVLETLMKQMLSMVHVSSWYSPR
jgi:hypothetical protein